MVMVNDLVFYSYFTITGGSSTHYSKASPFHVLICPRVDSLEVTSPGIFRIYSWGPEPYYSYICELNMKIHGY